MEEHIPKITALVLARGGSKSIPQKNIKILGGIPLLGWTLLAASRCHRFDSIWVSTDDPAIVEVAQRFGAQVHHRPHHSAEDVTPSIVAVQEFLSFHKEIEYLALLQCTSPCIQPRFLEEAYQKIVRHNYESVFAVCRQFNLRWTEVECGASTMAANFHPSRRPRRQDWKGELAECGMFYFTAAHLLEQGVFQGGRCAYVEIPKEYSLEIDTPFDWSLAEIAITKYGFQDHTG